MSRLIILLVLVTCLTVSFAQRKNCVKECPKVPEGVVGHCAFMCGEGCKYGQMCCSNGCGSVCTTPITKCY